MKAGGILHAMEKFCTFFGLHLSHLVFSATEQLSLSLQDKDTTVQEAIQASNLALNYLESQRSDEAFNYFYERLTNFQRVDFWATLSLENISSIYTNPAQP